MDSRDDILSRIRQRVGRTPANQESARLQASEQLASKSVGPQPPAARDLEAAFIAKSLEMSSTVARAATLADVPSLIAQYLTANNLTRQAACWPHLAPLDWSLAGIAVAIRGAIDGDLVGITGCFCAVAETGTLMLCSSPTSPATTSLLPETHIAVVPVDRIVASMEASWVLVRDELGDLPRAVNFVSGPSRTGDIEQTIVIGAHGPYRVHIVIVENA